MARTAKKVADPADTTTPRKRGGRKPGSWTLLTPEKLRAYRAENKLSRVRVAQMLGVSSTSVQNWETGTVASTKIQRRLADMIAAGASAIPPSQKATAFWGTPSRSDGNGAITATGVIVTGYVQTRVDLSPESLVALIRSVRQALS